MSLKTEAFEMLEAARATVRDAEEALLAAIEAGELDVEGLWGREFNLTGRVSYGVNPWAFEGYVDGMDYDDEEARYVFEDGPKSHMFGWYSSSDGPSC